MKKALAVIAMLAMVASAQAELVTLATWNSGNTVTKGTVEGLDTVSTLTLFGNAGTTSGDIFGVNKMTDGASGMAFTISALDSYEITGATLSGYYTGSATGPKQIDFWVNGNVVATHARPTRGSEFKDISLGDLGSSATVALVANADAGTVRSGASETFSNTAGSFVIRTSMTLQGNVVPASAPSDVPEPATMSLLGLGALALALRRKLRK